MRYLYEVDVRDPLSTIWYVINTEKLSVDAAVELITLKYHSLPTAVTTPAKPATRGRALASRVQWPAGKRGPAGTGSWRRLRPESVTTESAAAMDEPGGRSAAASA